MCIPKEKYEKIAKKLSRKLSEYKKESRKEFDKWRKENRVVCSEIEKNASQPSKQAPTSSSLNEEKDVVYNQKYEFPINEVLSPSFLIRLENRISQLEAPESNPRGDAPLKAGPTLDLSAHPSHGGRQQLRRVCSARLCGRDRRNDRFA